jgi:hypothetical protein
MPHSSEPEMPVTAKSSEPGTFRDKVPPKTQQETPQKTSPTSRQSSQGNEPESQSSVAVKTPETGLVKDKVPPDLRRDYSQPGGKSERVRFQEQSLAKALPRSARVPVAVNPKLEGNTVQVHYSLDKKGRVSNVHIEAGSGATPRDIELHARTVKSMKRYSGMSFHAQKLKDRLSGWVKRNGVPPVGSKAWEAKLEVEKLPHIISDRTERLAKGDLTPKERERLEREVTHLEHQLEGYQKDFNVMDKDPGKGFVAAESAGSKRAKREGYPEAEDGYRWVLDNGKLRYDRDAQRLPDGSERPQRAYDPATGKFVDVDTDVVQPKVKPDKAERRAIPQSEQSEYADALAQRDQHRDTRDRLEAGVIGSMR